MLETREIDPESPIVKSSPLASASLREHVLRGVGGLVAAVLAIALVTVVGPISLLLLVLTAVAWRGCPTCWTVGLIGTMADARARRECPRCSGGSRSLLSNEP